MRGFTSAVRLAPDWLRPTGCKLLGLINTLFEGILVKLGRLLVPQAALAARAAPNRPGKARLS